MCGALKTDHLETTTDDDNLIIFSRYEVKRFARFRSNKVVLCRRYAGRTSQGSRVGTVAPVEGPNWTNSGRDCVQSLCYREFSLRILCNSSNISFVSPLLILVLLCMSEWFLVIECEYERKKGSHLMAAIVMTSCRVLLHKEYSAAWRLAKC